MKLIFGIVLIILSQNIQSQTDSLVINTYRNIEEWQTKESDLDSIFETNYLTKKEGFLRDIYRNIKFSNHEEDNWFANYLVTIEISNDSISIDIKNQALKSDRITIEKTILSTKKNWDKSTDVKLNIVFSKYESDQIEEFKTAFIQAGMYVMGHCTCDECCRNTKDETLALIQKCMEEEEYYSATHYLKQLNRIYPFDMEINDQLKFALSKIKEIE